MGYSRGRRSQQEQKDAMHDWQDSAEKKLKHIKERMDELGPEVSLHRGWGGVWEYSGVGETAGADRCYA